VVQVKRRKPWNKGLKMERCMDCDGCGWVEGGKVLQTSCSKCKGRGKHYPDRSKYVFNGRTFVRVEK
jgi:DnaJ-class molecular chaperone